MSCMLWVLSWSESLFNEREICLLRVGTIRWYRQVVADRAHAPTINFIQVYGHNICLLAVCAIVLQWNPIFLSYAMIMNWFRLHLGPLSMNDILTFWATNTGKDLGLWVVLGVFLELLRARETRMCVRGQTTYVHSLATAMQYISRICTVMLCFFTLQR